MTFGNQHYHDTSSVARQRALEIKRGDRAATFLVSCRKMDFNSLRDQVSQISLYDVKAGIRKVQNGASRSVPMSESRINPDQSGHELHRDGGQGQGSNEQRAVGSLVDGHARDCQWYIQLVLRTTGFRA